MIKDKLVYSTDDSLITENQETTDDTSINIDQNIRLHLDRKKGGKITTVIKGFVQTDDRLKNLVKRLLYYLGRIYHTIMLLRDHLL